MSSGRTRGEQQPCGLRRSLRVIKIRLLSGVVRWLLRSHRFTQLARVLRLRIGIGGMWITRYEEVDDVLRRQRDFGMPYLARMEELGTPFILGLNPSPAYDRRRTDLKDALGSIDLARLRRSARQHAEEALAECGGEIDLIEGLTDRVLARTVGAELWSGGPLTAGQVAQARAVSRDIFINPFGDPDVSERAEAEVGRLRQHAKAVIVARREAQAPDTRRDVLSCLLERADARGGLETDELVDDLIGIMVAWITSVSRTMGFAFDELLRPHRSRQLALAQVAARNGELDMVREILFEALRFRPSMPALERVCTRETRLNGRTLRRGQRLLVVLTSAMMDGDGFPNPGEFRAGGPGRSYLHFGQGKRVCLGKDIASRQIEAIGVALLCRPNLRRLSSMTTDGPYPQRLRMAFDEAGPGPSGLSR